MRDVDQRLLSCAKKGDLDGVVSALDAGANINIQDKFDRIALMLAANWGHTEIADMLIQADTNVNIQDKDGWTTLMLAVFWGYTDIVVKLIQAGADPFIKNEDNWTASDIAREYGHPQIAELIEQRIVEQKSAELAQGTEGIEIHDMSRWL